MRFSVLASGSKANCTVVESRGACLLIDCGLSAKEAVRRLSARGIDPQSVSAILVTHEHRDHVAGIPVLSRRYRVPVYANAETGACLERIYGLETFRTGSAFTLGGLSVSSFPVTHDAGDPVGFTFSEAGLKLVYATDLGRVTNVVRDAVRRCNALILEFNHDRGLLRDCCYPWPLKQRIASSHGHLCNDDAAALVAELGHRELRHLVLGHISENSNTPETARGALAACVDTSAFTPCCCADPYRPTPMISLEPHGATRAA